MQQARNSCNKFFVAKNSKEVDWSVPFFLVLADGTVRDSKALHAKDDDSYHCKHFVLLKL